MSLYELAPKPPTKLGIYRTLSPTAGVHVSPLALGAMSIGDKWHQYGMGAMNKESSEKMLNAYFDAGGNFIDTANNYQDESSEEIIGEWAEKRGIRDQLVIATKYSFNFKRGSNEAQKVNYTGNNVKSMRLSVEASLKKLRTSYVDILYLHWWDFDTSVEEVMNGLHILVQQGRVLYLGISDTPAWIVSKANQYARDHGKTPFVIYQGMWNILERMTLAPWNVLAGGKFRTDEEEQKRRETGEKGREMLTGGWERNENEKRVSHALEKVAKEVGASHITAVAIAYLMQKTPYVFPLVGGRKVEQLYGNLEALDISLSPEQIKYLESIIPFDPGFPTSMIGDGSSPTMLLKHTAHFEKVPRVEPIRPSNN
ncbi:NADP-dependent oxidoreductase domain-containing protein [Suillus occidentalis]|nr:NADP-dependent oxidoreductase domain-containing protein [Suillus occidentalis]